MTIKYFLLFIILIKFLYANTTVAFTQAEQTYMKNKKEIRLCVSPKGLPLFGYRDEENIGILAELIQLIEKKIPIKFRYLPVETWEECIDLSKAQKVDLIGLIITTPNKHVHLTPTLKIIDGFIGITTKNDESFFNELNYLDGKKIAFLKGQVSVKHYVLNMFPNIKIIMVDSIREGLDLVEVGEVYGYADETYSLSYFIHNEYSDTLKIIDRINRKPISGSLGVQSENKILLSILNKAIKNMDEITKNDIIHKWIAVRIENKFDYTLFVQVFVLFMLILLVSLYWLNKLYTEVNKRKKVEKKLQDLNEHLEKEVSLQVKEIHYKDSILLEKTKLAAMGEMLGSIAHQWRRPLSSLHINVEMLEEDYKEDKIDQTFLDHFIKNNSEIIQYMSQTIDDFQNFYKVDKVKKYFDVMEKIVAISRLKLNQLDENHITISKEGESFVVHGFPSEFQQVIVNIIANAKDALLERKIINPSIKIYVWNDINHGYIEILDNAGGVDDEIIEQVCEPYFTTRESLGGMGFGLYISKMIIEKNMQGKLTLTNKEEGCSVLIMLNKDNNVSNK